MNDFPTPEQEHEAGLHTTNHAECRTCGENLKWTTALCIECGKTLANHTARHPFRPQVPTRPQTPPVPHADAGSPYVATGGWPTSDEARTWDIREMLLALGENPHREGLLDTPKRVIKAWAELTVGNKMVPSDLLRTFDADGYTGMVAVGPVEFYSTCEHHLLPFFGNAWVAYVPDKKIIGLSKLPKLVEIYARRLQNQERMTKQIADALGDLLGTENVAIAVKGQHMCMMARGVKQKEAVMTTADLRGVFRTDASTRAEFYALTGGK